jgi:DNA-binding response OmpR family regulator
MGGATSELRRRGLPVSVPRTLFSVGNLSLDTDAYRVTVAGEPVELTYQEFELLNLLAHDPRRIITSEALAQALWQTADQKASRRLSVVVCRLRQKIAASSPYQIETVRKRGYGLTDALTRPARP